ncbi:MAG: fimbrillin family protein [Odoribacteraceae bacterium]|jgi:hypothetical protein|nr:fimbrillin family protein [Odoribacteraceae bacterium]
MNMLFTNSHQRRALLACLALLASCGEPPAGDPGTGIVPLKFSVEVSPVAPTKAPPISGAEFPSGKYTLGLWICNHEATPSLFTPVMTGYGNLEANVDVTADGPNMRYDWSYRVDGTTFYNTLGVRQGTNFDIYACHPHVPGAAKPTEIPFTSGQTDWMVAHHDNFATTPGQTEATANLTFSHVMTCIQVNITCRYIGSVILSKMTLIDTDGNGLYSSGKINACTAPGPGSLVLDPATRADRISIEPNATLNNYSTRSFYIIMPEVAWPDEVDDNELGRFVLSFVYNGTVDGEDVFPLPRTIRNTTNTDDVTINAFETGKCYIYNLRLDNQIHFESMEVSDTWPETSTGIPLSL